MYRFTEIKALDVDDSETVNLEELLGDSDLVEMWHFNFCIDIEFVLTSLQPKSRKKVEAHFVHGYQPGNTLQQNELRKQAALWPGDNVHIHSVQLASQFATHHSKIMVLRYEGGEHRIVIHTANMIAFDWGNMTQQAWISPRLTPTQEKCGRLTFGNDFCEYLKAYRIDAVTALATRLEKLDYSAIIDRLVASVPGNHSTRKWGLWRLAELVPKCDTVFCQVSSIGALTGNYLEHVRAASHAENIKIVFPSVESISMSLNGYISGSSIHFKRQSTAQVNLYNKLRPHFCEWNAMQVNRQRAAPHIKTYTGLVGGKVAWYLLTSANLSKPAWGLEHKTRPALWIQSWECGVLRIPAAPMAPCESLPVPIDLPVKPYGAKDLAWSPHDIYLEPDWLGRCWPPE